MRFEFAAFHYFYFLLSDKFTLLFNWSLTLQIDVFPEWREEKFKSISLSLALFALKLCKRNFKCRIVYTRIPSTFFFVSFS